MTTGVVSPYTQWFKKQQKLLKDVAAGTVYSPEQAKTEFGLDVGAGWQVKIEEYEPVERMASFTYITPEGWQIKPDDILVSPEGEQFTRAEIEEARAAQVAPPPVTPPIAPAVELAFEELTEDYQLLYREYQRTGGVLDIPQWTMAGAPIRPVREIDEEFLRGLYTRASIEDAEGLLRVLVQGAIHEETGTPYTPEEIEQVVTETTSFFVSEEEREAQLTPLIQAVFPDYDLDDFEFMIREHPEEFISRMQEGGRTPEKEFLLRQMGVPQDEVDSFFKPWFEKLPPEGAEIIMEIGGVRTLVHIESPNLQVWAKGILIGRFNVKGEFHPTPKGLSEYLAENYIEPPQASKDEIKKTYEAKMREIYNTYPKAPYTKEQMAEPFYREMMDAKAKAWADYQEALKPEWTKHFNAGVGDVIVAASGVTRWMGHDGIADRLTKYSEKLQAQAPPDYMGEFEWSMMLNPRFYSTRVLRALPFTLSLLPSAVVGAYISTHIPVVSPFIVKHLGTYGNLILGSIGAASFSRPLESAFEAGITYDDAIMRGLTKEQADEAAKFVFLGNMVLGGWDAIQFGIAFIPIPGAPTASRFWKMAMVAGKLTIVGLTEAGEELYQETLQRWARGEEFKLDAEMQQVMAIGGIFGIGLGGVGEVFTRIKGQTLENLTPDARATFDGDVTRFEGEGLTREQAELRAFDELAKTEEGGIATADAIETIKREGFDAEAARYREIIEARVPVPEVVVPEVAPPAIPEVPAVPEAVRLAIPPDEPVSTTMIPSTQGMGGVGALEKYVRMPRKTFIKLGQWRPFFKPTQEAEVLVHEEQQQLQKQTDELRKMAGKDKARWELIADEVNEKGSVVGLTFNEKRVVAKYRAWADMWADRKNLPENKRIKDYMPHLFEQEAKRQIKEEGGIDPVLAKILSERATKKITDPFLKKRLGAVGWIKDPFAAMDAYNAVSLKVYYYTPLLNKIDAILADPDILQAVKNYFSEYSRRLTGEQSEFDKAANVHIRDFGEFIKDTPVIGKWLYPRLTQGNPAGATTYHLTGTLYLMYLGYKATSAIRNLSQHLLILGEVGPKHFVKGIALRVDKTAMTARDKGLAYRSRKFAYTAGIDATFVNRSADVVRETGMYMFRRIDKTNVTTGFLAGYSEAQEFLAEANNRTPIERRWSQERLEQAFIDRGDEVDADTQYLYTRLNSMPIAQSAIGRPASMLVTWTNNWIELMIKWAKRSESQVYAEFERETGTELKHKNWSHTYKAMLLYATIVGLAFAFDDKTPIKLKEYTGVGSIRYLAGTVSGELPFLEAYGATAKVVGGFVTDDERMLNEGLYELKSSFTPGIIKQLDDVSAGDKDWTNLFLYTEGRHWKILQLKEDWEKGWTDYMDFGDTGKRHEYALENESYRALSEDQMRKKWRGENPLIEAQMFIVGQFTILSSDEARAEVLRLIEEHKIDPDLVDGYSKIFGADIKSELQGFQDRIGNLEKFGIGEEAEYFKTSNYVSEVNRLVKKHGLVAVADSASPLTEFILGEQTTWQLYDDMTEEGRRLHRQQFPELEASLYLFGKVTAFQNPESAKILLQLMAQYGIPPESIQAFIDNPEKYDNLFSPRFKLEQDTYELTTLSKNYGNSESDVYIEDEEARNKARAKLREDNPDWVANLRRIEAMDKDATPEIMEGWVYRGTIVDEFGGSSREVKVYMLDNKDVHQWALDNELLTDDGKDWNEPLLRLQVDWSAEEDEYNALETASDRREYLFPNNEATDYCLAHYEIQSYEKDIPEGYRQDYITWYTDLSIKEKPEDYPTGIPYWEDNWWMLEHMGFHNEVWMGILDNQSYPIEIRTKDGVQYLIGAEGKPSKTPPTREMGAKYLEYIRISRGEIKYTDPDTELVYESKGQGADQYRIDNPDMDEWGVAVGIWATTMTEKRKQLGETPGEKAEREAQELIDWFKEEQERLRQEALR